MFRLTERSPGHITTTSTTTTSKEPERLIKMGLCVRKLALREKTQKFDKACPSERLD